MKISQFITRKISQATTLSKCAIPYVQTFKCSLLTKVDMKEQFDRDGFLIIRNALDTNELKNIQQWTTTIQSDAFKQKEQSEHASDNNTSTKNIGLHHFELDKKTKQVRIARTEKLDFHDGFFSMLYNGKIQQLASKAMGEPATLYKEKINYKYPNCGAFKPHQDAPAYPNIDKSIACAVSIDSSDEHSGCLSVAKGRHKEGVIGINDEGVIDDNIIENVENRDKLIYETVITNPGDILIFDSYLPHKSGINTTTNPRRILYATYTPSSGGSLRDQYYEKKKNNMKEGRLSFIYDFDGNMVSTIGNN